MNRPRTAALFVALMTLGGFCESVGQELPIGIVDFYGFSRVRRSEARSALLFKEGDSLDLAGDERPAVLAESERRLSSLTGVERAHIELVCCDEGRVIVFAGIEEDGQPTPHFRAAPRGAVRLPPDLVRAGDEFSDAFTAAVQRGDTAEDDSQGHALFSDPATRAVQERFIGYASRDVKLLRRVLHESSEAQHRALAAQTLAYVVDKQVVVDDLVFGMSDPSVDVRNNAMRALAMFARLKPAPGRPMVRVPYAPFVDLLHSLVWTDRNKAALALAGLSDRRDPKLLATLRRDAMTPLVEMARWKSEGHAAAALMILGRIGGLADEATQGAMTRGDHESIISAAFNRR